MRYRHLDPEPLCVAEPTTVGTYDAKTRLTELLDAVERGESFVITRHGRPVARLLPMRPRVNMAALAEEFREARKGVTLGISTKEAVEWGRK